MNLDDLCAIKIMGWKLSNGIDMYSDGQWYTGSENSPDTQREGHDWNPSTSLDDALVCLERACPDGFDIERMPHHPDEKLRCVVTANCAQARGLNPSVAIAMCLCSLRAMGVPESEIQEAMK